MLKNGLLLDGDVTGLEEDPKLADAYAGRMMLSAGTSVPQLSLNIGYTVPGSMAEYYRQELRGVEDRHARHGMDSFQHSGVHFEGDCSHLVAALAGHVEPTLRLQTDTVAERISHYGDQNSALLAVEGAAATASSQPVYNEFYPIPDEIEQLLRGDSNDVNFAAKEMDAVESSASQEVARLCGAFPAGMPQAAEGMAESPTDGTTTDQQLGVLLGLVVIVLQQIIALLPAVWSGKKRKREDSATQLLLLELDDETRRVSDEEDDEYSRLLPIVSMYQINLNSLLLAVARDGEDSGSARKGMDWFHEYQMGICNDEKCIENLRMSIGTFNFIMEALRPHCTKQMTNFKKPICVELKVAACIYKLVNGSTLAKTSEAFNIGKATVYDIMREIIPAIVKVFGQKFLWPSGQYMHEIMDNIQSRTGLPNCIGCIGSSHVSIMQPSLSGQDRKCRKQTISHTVQAVCDHNLRFTDVFVSMPGYGHDSKVLRSSVLWRMANNHVVFDDRPDTFPSGVLLHSYLLGDNSFPNLQWLITPFKHYGRRSLTEDEKGFNNRVNQGRVLIDQAFFVLKRTFQELARPSRLAAGYLPKVITACMCLHNVLLDSKELDVAGVDQDSGRSQSAHHGIEQARPHTLHPEEASGDMLREGLLQYTQFVRDMEG